jgi:hypothetical protein
VTISDVHLPFIARACETLGLPTSLLAVYMFTGDKGATRELENAAANQKEGFLLNAANELKTFFEQAGSTIEYPIIVKPCTGWNSDCVVKVQTRDELYAAVFRASGRHASSPNCNTRVVIGLYIDEPEIDANFVVLDGEGLFCDISDDFPCTGGHPQGTTSAPAANFMETLMHEPTNLSSLEQDLTAKREFEIPARNTSTTWTVFWTCPWENAWEQHNSRYATCMRKMLDLPGILIALLLSLRTG